MSAYAPVEVGPAHPAEIDAAFEIIFKESNVNERQNRVARALEMIVRGELDPDGISVARSEKGLLGAMVCMVVPGASGLVWPPQCVAGTRQMEIEDRLVQQACEWLRERGTKLAQALLVPHETKLGRPLLRNGFQHITNLWYMRLEPGLHAKRASEQQLQFVTYAQFDHDVFHRTLLRTYENTLDCPEVNGTRTVDEIIGGHRAQGIHDPNHWWIAFLCGQPVGVALVTDVPETQGWDVAYLGMVPEARRKGFGKATMMMILREGKAAGVEKLTLSVDERNRPAWSLYRGLGFQTYDERAVYLHIRNR